MSRELAALVAQHLHDLADDIAEMYGLTEVAPPPDGGPCCPPGRHVFAAEDDRCIAVNDGVRCGAPRPVNDG